MTADRNVPIFQATDPPERLRKAYERDGFCIVEGIFGQDKCDSSRDIPTLREAADEVTTKTRRGDWPYRRIVGKQFPPFDADDARDYWGVQHLLHPSLPHHDLFARFYASSPLLDICSELTGAGSTENMQLELFNLLINPEHHSFALSWHRDDIKHSVSTEEEAETLAKPTYGIQWNACLYDDDCLFVVPGTHKRLRTPEEKVANQASPPPAAKSDADLDGKKTGKADDGAWEVDPPTTLRVRLKAGQTAFYSQRILHRASYLPTKKRATLHGCYGCLTAPSTALSGTTNGTTNGTDAETVAAQRARNVLQHGVEWMREESFGQSLPARLKPMWRNLLKMDESVAGRDLGYSLDG